MSGNTDILIKELASTIRDSKAKKQEPYDTEATVRRVEGNIAWVHIPGGVDETPIQLSMKASKGDVVKVRVSGGKAWITGNTTAPPTDDATAVAAKKQAVQAYSKADEAYEDAEEAKTSADIAREAAGAATNILHDMEVAAEQAETSLTQIFSDTKSANQSAEQAAYAADTASKGLSLVEDIVGVLELVQRNGRYERTNDQEPLQDKWYFTRTGSGTSADPYQYAVAQNVSFQYILTTDTQIIQNKPYYTRSGSGTEEDPYVYTLVENPVVEEIGTYYENTRWNYFELIGIDEAIQNYVSSHLVFINGVLSLKNGGTEVALSTNAEQGLTFYNNGTQVAQYGSSAVVGNPSGFHITITANYNNTGKPRLSFYRDSINEVAYISGDKLYITQSVVLQQMDVGEKQIDGGLGQWSWKVHEVNGQNNLYLKWLG